MKFLNFLNEKYITRIKGTFFGEKTTEVFCNPSIEELRSIVANADAARPTDQYIRFVINFDTKKLYVWSGSVIHAEVIRVLYDKKHLASEAIGSPTFWATNFAGTGHLDNNKIVFDSCSDYLYENPDMIKDVDWMTSNLSWLNQWFKNGLRKDILQDTGYL